MKNPAPNAGDHEDTPKSAAAVTNGEAVLYLVLFVIFYIAGVGALIFYEVAYGVGSPVDIVHAIITNLWRAVGAALALTLTAAGILRSSRAIVRRLLRLRRNPADKD